MEAAPRGLDPQRIGERLVGTDGVREVHDLHVWEVTSGMPAVSAHMIVGRTRTAIRRGGGRPALLADEFGIEHSTLQVEHETSDELLQIDD